MRLSCDLILDRQNCTGPPARPSRTFITIAKRVLRGSPSTTDSYEIQVSAISERLRGPISLYKENVKDVLTARKAQGKATLQFKHPEVNLLISNANVAELERFLTLFNNIINGRPPARLDNLQQVKLSDLSRKRKVLDVDGRENYDKIEFPPELEELSVKRVKPRKLDHRWFGCKNLIKLDLSENNIAGCLNKVKLRDIARMPYLIDLNLSQNEFRIFYDSTIRCFSRNLKSLNLSFNRLEEFPMEILNLHQLEILRLEGNQLYRIPVEIVRLPLKALHIHANRLTTLPYSLRARKIPTLTIAGNPLNGIVGTGGREPTVSSLVSYAVASIKNYGIREDAIPWDIRIGIYDYYQTCTTCLRATGIKSVWTRIVNVRCCNIAGETIDQIGSNIPMLISACPRCTEFAQRIPEHNG